MTQERKLHILHLATHLNTGGVSSYLAVLSTALAARGHRVAVLSSGGQKTADLEKRGIRCFEFPIRTKSELSPKVWGSLPAVVSLIKKERFDLLHAHTRVTQVLAAAAGRWAGLPYISTAHGFYKMGWGRRLFPCWGERAVAVSALVAEELEKTHHVPPGRITVSHNALDLADFEGRLKEKDPSQIRADYRVPEGAFVVGCVSRLVRDKGQEYLIEAMRLLKGEPANIYLWIVGDGREKEALLALTEKYGLQKKVRLIPGITDTTEILSAVDVFVHPATFREGFGLSMAEAMIAKKPVVATRIPAIDTLFKDNVEALLVPPKDAGALAAAIRALAGDRSYAEKIAENGYQFARRVCRSERQAEEMEQVYFESLRGTKVTKQSLF